MTLALFVSLALLPLGGRAHAQESNEVGARVTQVHGALLTAKKSAGWQNVAVKSDVPTGQLLVALFGAEFRSPNDAVEMRLVADVGHRGPFPVLEAAARFHASKTVDLEVTQERGIAVFANKKSSGTAHVRLHIREEIFDVTLTDPSARLGVEIYGRQVPGPAQVVDPKKDDPVANIAFFALEGEVVIGVRKHSTRLHSPPGNALLLWDSVTREPEVQRFDTLPEFAKPMDAKEREKFLAICSFAKNWTAKPGPLGKALANAVGSAETGEAKAAVVALGALDELPGLMQVLSTKAPADAREMAVMVTRHWLGRAPGQSVVLYDYLTKKESYSPVQAKTLLYLFHGFEQEKLRQPGTFDALIHGLNHSKMPVRELSRWHLVRLVPAGKTIAYDAAAEEPQRAEAIAAWRRLIPEGELPSASPKSASIP